MLYYLALASLLSVGVSTGLLGLVGLLVGPGFLNYLRLDSQGWYLCD